MAKKTRNKPSLPQIKSVVNVKERDPNKFTEVEVSDTPRTTASLSTLDDFLKEEGIADEVNETAKNKISEDIQAFITHLTKVSHATADIHKKFSQAKSLRQEDNEEQRDDLYSSPAAHQTDEGRAAAIIQFLFDRSEFKKPVQE